jgi:DNA-binding MarR family transcriptional regulator
LISASDTRPAAAAEPDTDADRPTHLLFTFRITRLLDLVRRSSMIANRREFGLSGIESRIMLQIGGHAPLSLNELADLVRLDRGQLSRAVKAMVGRGLLNSRRRPGGPAIVITLSDEGEAVHKRMVMLARERNAMLLGDIPPEEVERTQSVLAAVTANAETLLAGLRASGSRSTDEESAD